MNNSFLFKICLVIFLLLPCNNWSQSIIGKVIDQEGIPLEFASIAIIHPKDSLLISYTSSNKYGKFELTKITHGKCIFQIHMVGFNPYQKIINFQHKSINMGTIKLESNSTLSEVLVNATVPILIKLDTIAYNIKAFKVRIDDNIEDLLKKLPGIEIDHSGKITAQGETINKIYVNGKDFFGENATVATKNLSADAIKRVEVIDEKSDRARVTGINDTNQKKIINLELKSERKINDFGKFQGGYGIDDRYLSNLNYNRFSPKINISLIGKVNNINSYSSDIYEIVSIDNFEDMTSFTEDSGFLTTGEAGLNFGYEFKSDQNINTNYLYNFTESTSGEVTTNRIEFIENQEIFSESKANSTNISKNHRANFNYKDRSNKLSIFSIRGSLSKNLNTGNSTNSLNKYDEDNELDLQSMSTMSNNSENSFGNVFFNYIKRFNIKSKRNFSTFGHVNVAKTNSINNNNQQNKFNISNPINSFESKQEVIKDKNGTKLNLGANLNYVEPLFGNHLIELNGNLNYKTNDDDVNQSTNENGAIQTPLIYNLYTENRDFKIGLFYKYDTQKFIFSAGANLAEQIQHIKIDDTESSKNHYSNINPEITIRFRPRRGRSMNLKFRKSVLLPSITQLSPVINDFNPLYINKGNPNLTPQHNYLINGTYVYNDFGKGINLFTMLNYNYSTNTIISSRFTDKFGVRTTTYENSGIKDNYRATLNFSKRVKSMGLRYSLNLRGGYSKYQSIINNIINETASKNSSLGFTIENNSKEKIDTSIGIKLNKDHTTFSTGNNSNRDYFKQSYFAKLDWDITKKFNINSQFKYNIYTDNNFSTDQSIPLWNASIAYSFLKSKNMNIMITALDILNKNIGIEQNSSTNYFEEVHKEVLGTYYMLSLTYNLKSD